VRKNLTFLAGRKALSIIKDEGLQPNRVNRIIGAAGGPKWLVLNQLDRVIFPHWLQAKNDPVVLIGSSIGAWRFAAAATKHPIDTIKKFQNAYIHQSYITKPTPQQVSRTSADILDTYLGNKHPYDALHHPFIRLCIITVRSKWPVASDKKIILSIGLAAAFFANIISRKLLDFFFERVLFYDPRLGSPPFITKNFNTKYIPLTEKNLKYALLASGSIPLVMSGVTNIQHAPQGAYRDGGLLDYHPVLPCETSDDLILFPHYMDRIIPGWMDKKLPWRKPSGLDMENIILVSPSLEFIDQLPFKKIPDRNDFYLFKGRHNDRIDYWNSVVELSKCLGEEFMDTVGSGKIQTLIKPMPQNS